MSRGGSDRRRIRPFAVANLATIVTLALLSGCVHIPSPKIPSFGAPGSGDAATFVIDDSTISVSQSGSITVSGTGTPLDYSGPLGCAGQYFEASYTENTDLDFRYGSQDAYILIGNDLYHFASGPTGGAGALRWDEEFDDRAISVTVGCPPPPSSPPLESPSG